jgi:hypothetical protein
MEEQQTIVDIYEGIAGVADGSNIRVNGVYHIGRILALSSTSENPINAVLSIPDQQSPVISLCYQKPKCNAVVYAAETSLSPLPAP